MTRNAQYFRVAQPRCCQSGVGCRWPASRLSNPFILYTVYTCQASTPAKQLHPVSSGLCAGGVHCWFRIDHCLGFSDKNVDTSGVFYVYGLPALIGGKPWLQSPGHGRLRSDNLGHEWTPLREYHSLGTDPGVFCALLQCHSFILTRSCLPGRDSFLCTIILELFTTL